MDGEVKRRLARLFPEIEQRWGGCERKLAYATLADALTVKERREARAGITLHVYPCDYGDHFHLSRQAPTAAQWARLRAEMQQRYHGMHAELRACQQRWAVLMREAEALARAIQQGPKRLARLPASSRVIQQLTQRYEAQRDDLIRLEDVVEQLTDVDLTRDQLLAWADVVLAYGGHLSAASDQTFQERCAELQAEAEAQREADAAWIRGALARLDADHAANLARAYLNTTYRLPSFQ